MAKKCSLLDLSKVNMNQVIADIHEIRRFNPQRYEMEQLTAVVHADPEEKVCVGYLDVKEDAFWCRGHMPGQPLMPGVMICEAAAQLASYCAKKLNLLENGVIGFGGMDNVKFRSVVFPGCRLTIVIKILKLRPKAMLVLGFEALVADEVVAEGTIKGIVLPS